MNYVHCVLYAHMHRVMTVSITVHRLYLCHHLDMSALLVMDLVFQCGGERQHGFVVLRHYMVVRVIPCCADGGMDWQG